MLLVGSLRQLFPRRRETPASDAFEDVFREHFDPVWRTSYALVGPDIADDVTQEVFLIVQRKLPEFDGPSLRAWIHGITRNVARNMTRTLNRRQRRNQQAADHKRHALDHLDERRDAAALMDRFLSRLPMPQREAFVLKEIEGFTAPEIAAAVGSPVQTIYTRLRAAKSELQRFRAELRAGGDGR